MKTKAIVRAGQYISFRPFYLSTDLFGGCPKFYGLLGNHTVFCFSFLYQLSAETVVVRNKKAPQTCHCFKVHSLQFVLVEVATKVIHFQLCSTRNGSDNSIIVHY